MPAESRRSRRTSSHGISEPISPAVRRSPAFSDSPFKKKETLSRHRDQTLISGSEERARLFAARPPNRCASPRVAHQHPKLSGARATARVRIRDAATVFLRRFNEPGTRRSNWKTKIPGRKKKGGDEDSRTRIEQSPALWIFGKRRSEKFHTDSSTETILALYFISFIMFSFSSSFFYKALFELALGEPINSRNVWSRRSSASASGNTAGVSSVVEPFRESRVPRAAARRPTNSGLCIKYIHRRAGIDRYTVYRPPRTKRAPSVRS